jgi:hypothetical protein
MRILRLARIAAEAEGLRLRRIARGSARRAVATAVALPFLLAGLGFLELALWLYLSARLPGWGAALAGAVANLLLALLLVLPALRRPARDPVAQEAARLRREAVAGIEDQLRLGSAVVDLVRALTLLIRRVPRP